MAKRKTKQMTIKDAIAWVESFEVLDREQEEAKCMAVQALQKQMPKRPVGASYGLVCPTCGSYVYDPDWTTSTKRIYHTEWCLCCGQRFTPLGQYLGDWAVEEGAEE